jgi:hypothetical protein
MAERIDHVAEARVLEQNAWQKGGPDGDALVRTHEQRQDMILSAQVHAMLALAEQQRIANLIAIYVAEGSAESGFIGKGFDFGYMADQIKEGLGL